jgi:hypothetical protein
MGQATRNIILDPSKSTAYKNYAESEKAFAELLDLVSTLGESISYKDKIRSASAWEGGAPWPVRVSEIDESQPLSTMGPPERGV